jgi:Glycosyltransferase sugar-binding region containing DXD motif
MYRMFFVLYIILIVLFWYNILRICIGESLGKFRQIPRNVFQTWHTKCLPPKMAICATTLRTMNPEFTFHLYDDNDCRQFISQNFDQEVVDAYDALVPGAFKADLWRYCVLYIHGGIYLDIKYECIGGFRLRDLLLMDCTWVHENDPELIYTGLLVRPPKCSKMLQCIRKIVHNVKYRIYGRTYTSPTGPDLLGGCFLPSERKVIRLRKNALYYYDDKSGTNGTKRGHIQCLLSGVDSKIIMSHYPEYREEQNQYGKTGYWINLWFQRGIYK